MLTALIHPADLSDLAARIRRSGARILARPFHAPGQRTRDAWIHTSSPPRQWTEIPLVRDRIRAKVTGRPDEDLPASIVRRYNTPGRSWRGFAPGCGTGARERAWFNTGGFSTLEAIDLSPTRIAEAQRHARMAGINDRLRFTVADIRSYAAPEGTFDIVIIEDALHHFTGVGDVLRTIRTWLRPGGLIVLNEFVGPSRFQWSEEQMAITNRLLDELPGALRIRLDGTRKKRVHRPGTLTMRLYDPSEAVDSAAILPALRSLFAIREERPYGGTILHLLLKDLAHHFLSPDGERAAFLKHCFEVEDEAMREGIIRSDFAVAVAQAPV